MFKYYRPTPRSGNNLVAPLGSVPAVVAETRGHGHGARGHMYQQSMHSSMQSSPFPPTTRRVRPRALTITSFIAAASSAEVGGPHGFSAPGAVNRSIPDAEGITKPYPSTDHIRRGERDLRRSLGSLLKASFTGGAPSILCRTRHMQVLP